MKSNSNFILQASQIALALAAGTMIVMETRYFALIPIILLIGLIGAEAVYLYMNASINTMTKLPNRLRLIKDKKKYAQKELTCIIFNIDTFDAINNLYSNAIGDALIIDLARWLGHNKPSAQTKLYKLESDIYAMLVLEPLKRSALVDYLDTISEKIAREKFTYHSMQIEISLTIGASQATTQQLKLAQIAYSQAKKERKSYHIYDQTSKQKEEYLHDIYIGETIKNALKKDLVIPYFQPILNIKTQKIEKYETLMRIRDKQNRILTPYEFLQSAKNSKMYPQLSQTLIKKSVDMFLPLNHEFSVNVSFLDISNKETTKFILDLLDKTGIGPWMIFELLESEGIANYKQVLSFIENIKSFGAKIAIDDFGSGYSNFERIVKLQVDFIKIDGSLIKNIHQNDDMRIITKTITNFAKELGIKTVAEFVHSAQVLEQVKKLDIDFAQGYYIAEPQERLLDSNFKLLKKI